MEIRGSQNHFNQAVLKCDIKVHIIEARELSRALDYGTLVEVLDVAFRSDYTTPVRHHHTMNSDYDEDTTVLLMPAWNESYLGVKTAVVAPGNAALGLPSVNASYQLLGRQTGALLVLIDGPELTARRTAPTSALASRYLSKVNSSRLLMIGTRTLAPHFIEAQASQRGIKEVLVWGRHFEKSEALVASFNLPRVAVRPVGNLEGAVGDADIVSCATLPKEPLIFGKWLRPGQHLDLVGGFTQDMLEADDMTVIRSRIFVDTEETAGDIWDPLSREVIQKRDILGTLFSLSRAEVPYARPSGDEITFFKSTGTALEDLAAAVLAYQRIQG